MSKLLSPFDWFYLTYPPESKFQDFGWAVVMAKYGEYVRDTTLEAATDTMMNTNYHELEKDSILSLKNHEDLKI